MLAGCSVRDYAAGAIGDALTTGGDGKIYSPATSAGHSEAAGNADHLPADKSGFLRCEKRDDARYVGGLPDALHWDGTHQRVIDLLSGFALAEEAAQDRRIGRSWTHHVHRDAPARDFARERLRERDDAALAGRVNRLARGADARRIGRNVDDAPGAARKHLREHEVMHVERPAQIDGNEVVPVLRLGIREALETVPAGIVHQHIDRALAD